MSNSGNDSLLTAAPEFPGMPASLKDSASEASRRGEYSGLALFDREPARYARVVEMMAAGASVRAIRSATGVCYEVQREIRAREALPILTHKRQIARDLQAAIESGALRMADEIDALPIQNLPLALGILIDKMQVLDGEASQIIETRSGATVADLQRLIDSLPEAQVVSLGETGLSAQESLGNAAGLAAAGDAIEADAMASRSDLKRRETDV